MAEGPENLHKRPRPIEGSFKERDTLDTHSTDWISVHAETAQRIVEAFDKDERRLGHDLSVWNVEVADEQLVQTMNDWQNYREDEKLDEACAHAREYLRRLDAGLIQREK